MCARRRRSAACRALRGAREGRGSAEHAVDREARAVLSVGPEVRVGVERLGRGRVAEAGLDNFHRLAMPDENAGVEVPQVVKGSAASNDSGRPCTSWPTRLAARNP